MFYGRSFGWKYRELDDDLFRRAFKCRVASSCGGSIPVIAPHGAALEFLWV